MPKIVFSGLILFSVVDGDLWRTAGFELLLGILVFCGSLIGAKLCSSISWRKVVSPSSNYCSTTQSCSCLT